MYGHFTFSQPTARKWSVMDDDSDGLRIPDEVIDAITSDLEEIAGMSDEDVCDLHGVDERHEAVTLVIEHNYYDTNDMTWMDYYRELSYRGIIEDNYLTIKKIA